MNVRLDGPRGSRITWMVHDPVHDDGWSSAQLHLIRRLLPHLRQTVRVQVALGWAGTLGRTLESLLEATGLGVVQLDRARAHRGGERPSPAACCATGDVLFDDDGRLFARAPTANTELQVLLARALPPFGIPGSGRFDDRKPVRRPAAGAARDPGGRSGHAPRGLAGRRPRPGSRCRSH